MHAPGSASKDTPPPPRCTHAPAPAVPLSLPLLPPVQSLSAHCSSHCCTPVLCCGPYTSTCPCSNQPRTCNHKVCVRRGRKRAASGRPLTEHDMAWPCRLAEVPQAQAALGGQGVVLQEACTQGEQGPCYMLLLRALNTTTLTQLPPLPMPYPPSAGQRHPTCTHAAPIDNRPAPTHLLPKYTHLQQVSANPPAPTLHLPSARQRRHACTHLYAHRIHLCPPAPSLIQIAPTFRRSALLPSCEPTGPYATSTAESEASGENASAATGRLARRASHTRRMLPSLRLPAVVEGPKVSVFRPAGVHGMAAGVRVHMLSGSVRVCARAG